MQESTLPLVRAPLALPGAFLLALLTFGCADELQVEAPPQEGQHVLTEPGAGGTFTTRVDASDAERWIYFAFQSGAQVTPADASNSSDWDLGFQRFHILSNGGVSGAGGAAVAVISDRAFEAVTEAPAEGYVADQPDSDDDDAVANSAFESGDGWYDYDPATNRLSPRGYVYVVQSPSGARYKLEIVDYYDGAGSSGHPSFAWAEL